MNYYLAGLLSRKDELAGYALQVEEAGDVVTSSWLTREGDHVGAPRLDYTSDRARAMATEDLADVERCDVLVLFTEERSVPQRGGGRFIEFGYARALGKRLVIVGDIENLFLGAADVEHYEDWSAFLAIERQAA